VFLIYIACFSVINTYFLHAQMPGRFSSDAWSWGVARNITKKKVSDTKISCITPMLNGAPGE
jgi:hypothetical protein